MHGELVPASNRTPELAGLNELRQLVAGWLLGYANQGTRSAYGNDLSHYAQTLAAGDIAVLEATRAHVDAYARQLEANGFATATVARRLSAIASFYAYAVDENAIAVNPAARVRRPRVSDESPRLGLDRDELNRLLEKADAAGPRDLALVSLLSLNGLRVSEACGADVGDLGEERGHRVLAITRKRGYRATIPLAPRTSATIIEHVGDRTEGPLLLANDGGRLDRHDAARIIHRLARAAGMTKKISPHSLRHTFVTLSLDAGVSLRDVQDAAGHADPRTTRRYDRARHSHDRHPTYRLTAYID